MTNSSRSGMDILISNTKKITEKCLMFCVKSVFISGLLYTTRTELTCVFFERVCVFIYIDNRIIRSDSLYKDDLHLIDKGKAF